jgi:hypothetical protein
MLPDMPEEWAAALQRSATTAQRASSASPTSSVVEEGGRNAFLASRAGYLRRGGFSEAEIHAALDELNRNRCRPPLSDAEVAGIARSCARYEPGVAPAHDVGSSRAEGRLGETSLQFTSMSELLAEPLTDVQWLVEGRLSAGGISLLAGKPKSGKSTLARALALAVARGEPFLGWTTSQGAVAYIALEDKRDEIRAHFEAQGATGDEPLWLFVGTAPGGAVAQLRDYAFRERPRLIVIDTIFRFARVRDTNDYAVMTAALEPVLAIARETGAHVLLVCHAKKGDTRGGDAILGSTALFGTVDTALILSRNEQRRTLCSIQRYGSDLPETVVELDEGGRPVASGTRQEVEEAIVKDEIRAVLSGRDREGLGEEEIFARCSSGKTKTRRTALRSLVATGEVQRTGDGKKGSPFAYTVEPGVPPESDARSLVPSQLGEQGNEKPGLDQTQRDPNGNSRSPDSGAGTEEHLL